jgi:hypothetical protein
MTQLRRHLNRQRLLTIIAILVLNILVSICAGIALVIYVFREDWIMASVPGTVALIGILLQPWSLLFLLLPGFLLSLSPFLTTAVTFYVYSWLDRQGRLNKVKRVLSRAKVWQIVWGIALAIATGSGIMYARYRDFPALNRQPPSIIREAIAQANIPVRDSYTYTISSFIDSEYIWQARLTPQDFGRLRKSLGVGEIKLPNNKLPPEFSKRSPYWWHPRLSSVNQVYATSQFPFRDRGQDGVHIFMVWNPEDKIVHLWLKNNF